MAALGGGSAYYIVVTYIIENTYTVVAYDGNIFLAGNYFTENNNRNTGPICEICSKLTIKTPEQCQWLLFNVLLLSNIALMFLLLILKVGHTLF